MNSSTTLRKHVPQVTNVQVDVLGKSVGKAALEAEKAYGEGGLDRD